MICKIHQSQIKYQYKPKIRYRFVQDLITQIVMHIICFFLQQTVNISLKKKINNIPCYGPYFYC